MKYQSGQRRPAIEYEKALIDFWKKDNTFQKSIDQNPADKSYVFYDGPPFITGNPHHGTLLSSIVKDAVPRFWTMNGYMVERRWGWDCHGLPAENFTEKHLGGTVSRTDDPKMLELKIGDETSEITLEKYIQTARDLMVANSETWESTIDRIGRWVDFRGAYKTMDKDFMESVWWAFKGLYEKGKIYEGERVLMYDTTFATPVSKTEVTMDNDAYQSVTDPSVYVKFKLTPVSAKWLQLSENTYMLAWTTTPWTLPGNTALAVNPELSYVLTQKDGENLILAKDLAAKVVPDHKILQEIPGTELVGLEYHPIFAPVPGAHKIHAADYVTTDSGTGIVHLAPVYGEVDFELAEKENIPKLHVLDDHGYYYLEVAEQLHKIGVRDTDEKGIEVWAANKFIAKCLANHDHDGKELTEEETKQGRGIVWKIDYIQHEYPFNPRSKQRIMYRAIPSWFFNITDSKPLMLEKNQDINWFPPYLKNGRFAKNIEQAPDWNLSRDRFWATPMPVWKGDQGSIKVVGSYAELEQLSGIKLDDYHRPWVDDIEFDIAGEHFTRIEKVLDCWFESGSMPFAQLHYPFENKAKFESNYPADFIVEYIGQVRAWFYYVHAVNTALFGENAYKNVITTGTLAGNDGRKMSKSLGNYTDPNQLMDKYSADALRFLMLSSPVLSGEDFALLDKDVSDISRKLAMIWNVYDFFTMYAEVDGWDSNSATGDPDLKTLQNPLDIWIISRAYELRDQITENMTNYNIPDALSPILPFIDDLSNWFVRRSRRRFWKSEDDVDKSEAYATLHFVLTYTATLLAPFTPFLAEELWQKLTGGEQGSVHLQSWPHATKPDQQVLDDMKLTRNIIEKGLALRMDRSDEFGQIKIRQPLLSLTYGRTGAANPQTGRLNDTYEQTIKEELNVREVKYANSMSDFKNDQDHILMDIAGSMVELDKKLTPELRAEGFARELIRHIQTARKSAGLNVDDRIKLSLSITPPQGFADLIAQETLATSLTQNANYTHDQIVNIDDQSITISLEKA